MACACPTPRASARGTVDSLIEVDMPHMLGVECSHRLEEVALGLVSRFGGRVDIGAVLLLAQAREATSEELGSRHGDGACGLQH